MRLKLLLIALLALVPLPALADVTAHYSAGTNAVTIAADDGGNFRAEFGPTVTLIRREGVDYVVMQDSGGQARVTRADDLLAIVRAQMANPETKPPAELAMEFALTSTGDETVAGHAGTLWRFGLAGKPSVTGTPAPPPPGSQLDFVISTDPALAPIGGVFRHVFDAVSPVMLAQLGEGNFLPLAGELLAKGTPIRVGPLLTLDSVDTAEIAAARFELPGPVLPAAEFMTFTGPPAPAAMPPLP
jgi:hypothetical protein